MAHNYLHINLGYGGDSRLALMLKNFDPFQAQDIKMAYGTQKVRIEMEIPADVDPSVVLEMAQELACELSDTDDDDIMSETDMEIVSEAVSVEVLS